MRVTAACWFDTVWAIVMDAPHEALTKAHDQMVLQQNRARPDRDTWGVSEDEQALMARAMKQQPAPATATPSGRKRGDGRPI